MFPSYSTTILKDIDVNQLFKEKFSKLKEEKDFENVNRRKYEWIKNFIANLEFSFDYYKHITPKSQLFFQHVNIKISNRKSPFEKEKIHKYLTSNEGKILSTSLYSSLKKLTFETRG